MKCVYKIVNYGYNSDVDNHYYFCMGFNMNKHTAFTLAETLITLAIIGIVAAMTIPSLINNIQDRHFKALWKKTFSQINQAYQKAFIEEPLTWPTGWMTFDFSKEIYAGVLPNLTKDYCIKDVPVGEKCSTNTKISPPCRSLNKDKVDFCYYAGSGGYAKLNTGVKIYLYDVYEYPGFLVDVNDEKGPNTLGRDLYVVLFRKKDKIIPGGAPGYELKGCDKSISSTAGAWGANSFSGSGCGYKYLYE